ncbi:hypothetical protein SARC_02852 [Sphaeroforma arctica JP610]|uniref:Uncharacterized protein n=1 Tax=Sphaeroforma arctica JP610 TaxID=667725 RepID=A0A0L0G7N3_9EUKA|nr:hypothetical protein SARC_02852 [Sphaeroforma arctica JP610]KNC84929.1 hypothetical protein SARC_02852 [Sphaeroforma arctica JP610]|eukprot:XP_014158831.1 hypothetical protein SARC_02852 [Sphaeroforma arctica JP610]
MHCVSLPRPSVSPSNIGTDAKDRFRLGKNITSRSLLSGISLTMGGVDTMSSAFGINVNQFDAESQSVDLGVSAATQSSQVESSLALGSSQPMGLSRTNQLGYQLSAGFKS